MCLRFILALITFSQLFAKDFSALDVYQESLTKQEIEKRLFSFLQKDEAIQGYFSLNEDAFILYDAPGGKVEYCLKLSKEKQRKKSCRNRAGLAGVKIAIDPGHFGGVYAKLEERFIDIPPSLERKEVVQFDEGTLSFLTAVYLKSLLEKEGAIVMLTREGIGRGAYDLDFFDWLKAKPTLWSKNISLHALFRKLYNPLDLRARAKKINAFCPDLSIIIHFNSHHVKEEQSSNHFVTAHNYNLVFVPGAFCKNELDQKENRFEFLRLLATSDLENSILLSQHILQKFKEVLQVPLIEKADGARYLDTVCMKVKEGVYSRNLALTRMIHGPICYGESLIQNNVDECQNLSRKDFTIQGISCSSRLKQVAQAYFEGIKKYLAD